MREDGRCDQCGELIEPERAKWAKLCLDCGDPKQRKRQLRRKDRQDNPEYTDYVPEKADLLRETFQERDPEGRTYSQYIYEWRAEHPEQWREQRNRAVGKCKLIKKLKAKEKLVKWGLSEEQAKTFCRRCSIDELPKVVGCLRNWDGTSPRTFKALYDLVKGIDKKPVSAERRPTYQTDGARLNSAGD